LTLEEKVMIESDVPEALQVSLDSLTGIVMRHGPDAETRTFICMATHLGDGAWATFSDNVFGGRVYDQFMGTQEIVDIWIHTVSGGVFPARWGHMAIVKPLAILYAPGSGARAPEIATAAEMSYPDYRKVWRNSFGGAAVFADGGFDTTRPTVAVEGRIFHRPAFARWDVHREERALAVLAGMSSPGKKDAGGPVVDDGGRLAGMLLGPDYGAADEHKGWYMPVDYILPSLEMARAGALSTRERLGSAVDYVSHRSHDVDFVGV
jgi:hypothetical protein